MTKDPAERAKDIIGVVVNDPNVDQNDPDEIENAALELASDMCLYKPTEEKIRELASSATFKKSGNTNPQRGLST